MLSPYTFAISPVTACSRTHKCSIAAITKLGACDQPNLKKGTGLRGLLVSCKFADHACYTSPLNRWQRLPHSFWAWIRSHASRRGVYPCPYVDAQTFFWLITATIVVNIQLPKPSRRSHDQVSASVCRTDEPGVACYLPTGWIKFCCARLLLCNFLKYSYTSGMLVTTVCTDCLALILTRTKREHQCLCWKQTIMPGLSTGIWEL